jgi:AraC-like DNA-binding protein
MASLTLDWLLLAATVGALQGVILAGVLVAQKNNRTANRLLAILVVTLTIFLASTVYFGSGLFRAFPHFVGVAYQTPWMFGPLMYLYAVAASDRAWRFQRRDILHFVPVFITVIASIPTFVMSGPEKLELVDRIRDGQLPGILPFLDPTKFLSGIGYSIATVMYVYRHRRRVEDSYSNTERVNLRWLLWITAAMAAIWGLAIFLKLGGTTGPVRDPHISLAMAVLIYAIGYQALRQPEIFRYDTAEFPIPKTTEYVAVPAPAPEPSASASRYERTGLSEREAQQLRESLLRLMERDCPWKESELTLADLAARLNTTPHKLSEVLNSQIQQSFYDFVNGYRVREVQRRIKAGEARSLKMLALALDAGFASKSTFNDVFKKHTAQTPSGFRQAVGA